MSPRLEIPQEYGTGTNTDIPIWITSRWTEGLGLTFRSPNLTIVIDKKILQKILQNVQKMDTIEHGVVEKTKQLVVEIRQQPLLGMSGW